MEQVIIGVDPHKLSATIEVVDRDEQGCGGGDVGHHQDRTADALLGLDGIGGGLTR
jgi:hypothetical protein